MLKKRFKLNFMLPGAIAIFLAFTLFPLSAQSGEFGNTGWTYDGFVRNNTGLWTENWDNSENNDPLAVCRNWFRLNIDGKFTKNIRLMAEVLAVYEPEYSREHHATEADGTPVAANEYNYFDFRELRLDMRLGRGHMLLFGRQIVNWGGISQRPESGMSLTRLTVALTLVLRTWKTPGCPSGWPGGFTPLSSQAQPLTWTGWFHLTGSPTGTGLTGPPSALGLRNTDGSFTPAVRFAAMPESLSHMTKEGLVPFASDAPAIPASFAPLPILGAPFNNYWQPSAVIPGAKIPAYGAVALDTDYPDSNLDDLRYGFKMGTTIKGVQTGVYYWHHRTFDGGVFELTDYFPAGYFTYQLKFPREDIYGFFANYLTSFGVLRMDAAYRPNKEYNQLVQYDFWGVSGTRTTGDAVTEKDLLKLQVGFNKEIMWPKLNVNNAFSLTLEYILEYILDSDMDDIAVPGTYIKYKKDTHTLMASLSTLFAFKYSVGITVLHTFNYGGCGLIQPSFSYTPDWMNNAWKFALQYSCIYGPDYSFVYGLLKEKDMVLGTIQYSF